MHSAKGREWKVVRILIVVDGCIPSDMAQGTAEEIEEERRLLHVAMTRAKDELDLMIRQRFFTYNQGKSSDLKECFDCRAWSDRAGTGNKSVIKSTTRINVADSVGRMWR